VAIINRLFWAVFGGFLGRRREKGGGNYSFIHFIVVNFDYLFVFYTSIQLFTFIMQAFKPIQRNGYKIRYSKTYDIIQVSKGKVIFEEFKTLDSAVIWAISH